MPSSCRIYYVVFDIQHSWGIIGWWSHVLLSSCSLINVIFSLGIFGRWSNLLQSLQHRRSWTMMRYLLLSSWSLINVWALALLADEATSFNPFALLSTTYVLLHGRSWTMKPHASILLPIHLESSRSSAALSVSFQMQLECIYVSCLHRWTSTLRSTWITVPYSVNEKQQHLWPVSMRVNVTHWIQFYQRERWTWFYPVTFCVWKFLKNDNNDIDDLNLQ